MKLPRGRLGLLAVAICLAIFGPGQAQQPQQQTPPQRPTFRAGVSAVRVDVIVTDRQGTPADNLGAADFDVIEDGKPQTVDSCKLIRVQTRQEPGGEAPRAIRTFEDEETELARDDVRIIVMLLDDYHVSRISAMNLRGWLHRFVDTQLGPYDLLALMYPMTPTSALTFTRDKFALTSVIDRFEGRLGDYMPRNQIEGNYSMEQPWRIEELRSQVVASAIKSACYHLGTLNEGRKSLIVVAETLSLPGADLRELIDAANRNNVAIYPLDPGIMSAFGAGSVLRSLADETNGRAITERNNLDQALAAVLRDSSAYYLLGYNSSKGADGKFHEIKVRVKKPGLEVRARKGYWALTAAEAALAQEPPKPAAPAAVTTALGALAQPRGRVITTWLGASRGDNGRTRLTFVWEPVESAPGLQPATRVARVSLKATDASGSPYFEGSLPAPVQPARLPASQRAFATSAHAAFDVPPGRLQMRMSIEDGEGLVVDSDVRDIDVPDLSGRRLAISTPSIFHARSMKEFREAASDPAATPTAGRQFSRAERLLVRFDVYTPGPAPAAVTARLLNRFGREMAKLSAGPDRNRTDGHTIDLPLAGLSAGEYVIEIRAKGESGEASATIAIRVTV